MYHQVCICVCVCVCVFGQVVWFEFVRTSHQLNAPFCNQFLHLCMYHQVCMCVCVCVFGQVVWFEFVGTSHQLNAAFCNQFLHLCMYHQVCMCVCVASARLCDLSLSDLVSNQTQPFAINCYIFACTMSYLNTFSSAPKRCKRNDLPKSSPQGWGHKTTKAPRLSQLGVPRTPLTSICGVRLSILNQMLQKQGLYIYIHTFHSNHIWHTILYEIFHKHKQYTYHPSHPGLHPWHQINLIQHILHVTSISSMPSLLQHPWASSPSRNTRFAPAPPQTHPAQKNVSTIITTNNQHHSCIQCIQYKKCPHHLGLQYPRL